MPQFEAFWHLHHWVCTMSLVLVFYDASQKQTFHASAVSILFFFFFFTIFPKASGLFCNSSLELGDFPYEKHCQAP